MADATPTPAVLTAAWSMPSGTDIGTDRWKDTSDDEWKDVHDVWYPHALGDAGEAKQVDAAKQDLTWTLNAPTTGYNRTVYPFGYVKDEDGKTVFDEAGLPIKTEGSLDDFTLTWTLNPPEVYFNLAIVSEFHITWSLNAPYIDINLGVSALTASVNLGAPTLVTAVLPDKQDVTWAMNAPAVPDAWVLPSVQSATWTLNGINKVKIPHYQKRGLLTGVY